MSALPFAHLLLLQPLGLLYGSSGRLLSPEALTGRAAEQFPPDAPTIAGLIASQLQRPTGVDKRDTPLWNLHTAGPFCYDTLAQDLWLPAPFTLLQEASAEASAETSAEASNQAEAPARLHRLHWARHEEAGDGPSGAWHPAEGQALPRNATSGGWLALRHWPQLCSSPSAAANAADPLRLHANPWKAVPHLHPRLRDGERVSAIDTALFLEYGIALNPGVCLAYLSSVEIADGRYRFGGEGHLVELRCQPLPPLLQELLQQPLTGPFALITPGLWGGPRLSRRDPLDTSQQPATQPWHRHGVPPAILTERPRPWRHQLGASTEVSNPQQRRRLSRGRWAVPAGSCYRVEAGLPPWAEWPTCWFPKEGFSFKHYGTALALPLHPASA